MELHSPAPGVRWGTLLYFWMLLSLLVAAPAAAGTPAKTLTRFHDPVIVSTAALSVFADDGTERLRLYRVRAGQAEAIPYQFDPFDENGEVTFPSAGVSQEFRFDDNDQLVFMAKDTGDRADPSMLPTLADRAVELEVRDPHNDQRGWVYLLHFPGNPPAPSPVRYVHFDVAKNRAESAFYRMDYAPGRDYFVGMTSFPAAGGNGENLLDRMKIRIQPTLSFLFFDWGPLMTEDSFSASIIGIKNGPVRAIRQARHWIMIGHLIPMPSTKVYTYYYFSSFITPSHLSLPGLVMHALRDFRFDGTSDLRRNSLGMTYWDGANPEGIKITGKPHPEVNRDRDHDWWVISGAAGTTANVFLIPDELRSLGVERVTYFRDDDTAVDTEGNEAEPGRHEVGYSLKNVTRVRHGGEYDSTLATVFLPRPYQRGDEQSALSMLKQPLETEVRAFPAALDDLETKEDRSLSPDAPSQLRDNGPAGGS